MKFWYFLLAVLGSHAYANKKDNSILKVFETKNTTTIIVDVLGSNVAAIRNQVASRNFIHQDAKVDAMYNALKAHADSTQSKILFFLDEVKTDRPIYVHQLWTSNQIIIKNVDYSTVKKLLSMDEVTAVQEDQIIPLARPISITVHPDGFVPTAAVQWGVFDTKAPSVWNKTKGGGVVVGSIDTGVRYTHEILKDNFRSECGWWDYTAILLMRQKPYDDVGHGTHTMGTIVGGSGFGMAFEAKWITCKACSMIGCTKADLMSCGQWITCPTDLEGTQNCKMRPGIVSNSWGGGQVDSFYNPTIQMWLAAGIVPVFANGNSGGACRTANSPADIGEVISVGACNKTSHVADFSSRGPTVQGKLNPVISGPGVDVMSAYHMSDTSYSTMSGTSMACPHVAGAAALIRSEHPDMTYVSVKKALESSAMASSPTNQNCGDIPDNLYPNNNVGYGRLNVLDALENARNML